MLTITFSQHDWQWYPHNGPDDASCIAVGEPYTISVEVSEVCI